MAQGTDNPVWGRVRTSASHTIGVPHLSELLAALPADATFEAYRDAVVEENALGRPTRAGRLRTFRHLREVYLLDGGVPAFAALRRLHEVDPASLPLLAGLLAFTRDELLRASWPAIAAARPGERVTSEDLTAAVASTHANSLSPATLGKVGRNAAASWAQIGHLEGRTAKVRRLVDATPAAVAFSAYLGHLDGGRGTGVLDNPWSALLDLEQGIEIDALRAAHRAGLLDMLVAGDVVEVSFPQLERPGA